MLQELEEQRRAATEDEQRILSAWSAWGALPEVFDETATRTISAWDRQRVRELLGPEGWAQARATTLNAHYTDPAVASAMWDALSQAGFEGGPVLEPGCGSGEFIGLAPESAQMVGVEVDPTTARIAAHLHPDQQIHSTGFEKTAFQDDAFHATVGNVPFGNFRVQDTTHNGMGHSIHNHFILKSLRLTAPGGYVAVMTSAHTMDSKRTTARREMARYGDLVGAVRLPAGAMAASAGTEVGTDVLVFRRRMPDEKPDADAISAWVEPGQTTVTDREGNQHELTYSRWFGEHEAAVLGDVEYGSGPFGPVYTVTGDTGEALAEQVRERLTAQLSESAERGLGYGPVPAKGAELDLEPGLRHAPQAEAAMGHVRYNKQNGQFERYRAGFEWAPVKVFKKDVAEARALVQLRDAAAEVITSQRTGAPEQERVRLRENLRAMWEVYVAQYGPISRGQDKYGKPSVADRRQKVAELDALWRDELPVDGDVAPEDVEVPEELRAQWEQIASEPEFKRREQSHLKVLMGDPKLGLLRSMENFDEATQTATPAGLLTRDVVTHRTRPERAESVEDAIAISMDEHRRIEVDRVASLLGVDTDEAERQLAEHAFTDPTTGQMVPTTTYLSGNVRQKLAEARQAADRDGQFRGNVKALEAVVPDELALEDVTLNVGVRWIPERYYSQFVSETLKAQCQVRLNPGTDAWEVEVPKGGLEPAARYAWGTEKRTPAQLMAAAMNMKAVTVTVEDADGNRYKDEQATAAARAKVEQIRDEFRTWMLKDPERVRELQGTYNDLFNAHVAPDYSEAGARLQLPGLSEAMTPYSYQRSAVARAVSEPTVLLDHVVGAGKTGSMIMSAMELKRTGIVSKPAMVVPNHLVDQIATEAVQWYPDANVIAVPTGLSSTERQEWMSQVGAGEWDMVIVPQSVFERVQIDPAKQADWLAEAISELEANTANQDSSAGWVKRAEKAKKSLERDYDKARKNNDPGVTFEETGIDYLLVDEAHMYKNLKRASDLGELSCAGSNRALDLDFKLRALREAKLEAAERNGQAGPGYLPAVATFATGTPVANNMAEMWVMQHYLRPDLLETAQLESVNAWAQAFTKVKPQLRPNPTGGGFQQVVRVSEYVNVPELMSINSAFTDVVLREDLETKLPTVEGGDRQLMARPPSERVQEYVLDLQKRAELVKSMPPTAGGDNMLVVVGDGRKVALDPRLVGLEADEDGGRIGAVADQIMATHEQTKDNVYLGEDGQPSATTGALQIVFCDQSTPKPDQWNVYDQLGDDLAARGMDPDKVAFIHDAHNDEARKELFERCRDGRVNVIIGSTEKMGTGTNIQARAVALHHMDVPWRPADLEQREGRIIRQGNQNEQVAVYAWATEETFDVYSWDMIARKARFISQLKAGQLNGRQTEDVMAGLEVSGSSAVAVLANDPRIMQLAELQMDVEQLTRAQDGWARQRAAQRVELGRSTQRQSFLTDRLDALASVAGAVTDTSGDAFAFTTTDGQTTTRREEAGEVLVAALRREAARSDRPDFMDATDPEPVGTLGGVRLGTVRQANHVHLVPMDVPSVRRGWTTSQALGAELSAAGAARSAENFVACLPEQLGKDARELEQLRTTIPSLREGLTDAFPQTDELAQKQRELAALQAEMNEDEQESSGPQMVEYRADELEARGLIGHANTPHEGDVWEMNGAFYAVGRKAEDVGTVNENQLYAWPAEGEPGQDAFSANQLRMNGRMVMRREIGLTEMERRCMEADPEHDVILAQPSRLRDFADFDGEVLREEQATGQVRKGRLDAQGNMVESGTGELIENARFTRYGSPMILIGATSPEKEAAKRAEAADRAAQRSPRDFLPGEVLMQDIEGFGAEGDIVRVLPGQRNTVAVSPDTGQVRTEVNYRVYGQRGHFKTAPPAQLSDGERTRLYGAATIKAQVSDLRPGDTVMATDLDRNATSKEAVTVLHTGGGGTRDLVYRGQDGEKHSCKRRESTQIPIMGRTRAALNLRELATLDTTDGQPVQACQARDIHTGVNWVGRTLVVDTLADRTNRDPGPDGLKQGTVIDQQERTMPSSGWGQAEKVALLRLRTENGREFTVSSRDTGHVWETQRPFDAQSAFGVRTLEGSAPGQPAPRPDSVSVDGSPRPDTVSGQTPDMSGQARTVANASADTDRQAAPARQRVQISGVDTDTAIAQLQAQEQAMTRGQVDTGLDR